MISPSIRPTSPYSRTSAPSLDPKTQSFFVYEAIKKRSAKQLKAALRPFSSLTTQRETTMSLFAAPPISQSDEASAAQEVSDASALVQPQQKQQNVFRFKPLPLDAVGRSPLFRACESGQLELVSILLEFYERKYDEEGKFAAKPAATAAASGAATTSPQHSLSSSQAMSRRGSTFVAPNSSCSRHHPFATSLTTLLAASKFLSSTTSTTRATSASLQSRYTEPQHAKESQLNDAFLVACTYGTLDLVLLLLNHGANPNGQHEDRIDGDGKCSSLFGDTFGYRPIHGVAQRGFVKAITLMIRKGVSVNVADSSGISALCHACAQGHEKAALLLKVNGADVNAQDKCGFSVLHTAVLRNQTHIVKMLLEDEEHIGVNTVAFPSSNGASHGDDHRQYNHRHVQSKLQKTTPLIDAIRLGHKRIVRLLLESPNCDPTFSPCNSYSSTPLRYAVLCGNSKAVLRLVERFQRDFDRMVDAEIDFRKQQEMTSPTELVHRDDDGSDEAGHLSVSSQPQRGEERDVVDDVFVSNERIEKYDPINQRGARNNDEDDDGGIGGVADDDDEEGETVLFDAIRLGYTKIIRRLCRGAKKKKKKEEEEAKNTETRNNNEAEIDATEVDQITAARPAAAQNFIRPQFKFANVTLKSSIMQMTPIDVAVEREMQGTFTSSHVTAFLRRKIPLEKPKSSDGGDSDEGQLQLQREISGEMSLTDSMFIQQWNEKQRREKLRAVKDEAAVTNREQQRTAEAEKDDEIARKKKVGERKEEVKGKKSVNKGAEDETTKKPTSLDSKSQAELDSQKTGETTEEPLLADPDEEEEEEMSSDDDSVQTENSDEG